MKSVALLLIASLTASPLLAQVEEWKGESEGVCELPRDWTPADTMPAAAEPLAESTQEPPREPPQEPEPPKEPPPTRPSLKPRDLWHDVKVEAKRYLADSYAIVTAPLHWSGADWTRFGGVVLVVGGLMLADRTIDREVRENRSRFTDDVSDLTTDFGGGLGSNIGIGFLAAGYLFRSSEVRETGREMLEASFLTHVLSKWVFKPAFGRERPSESDGETRFQPGSSQDSFPSGHATQAFTLASVIAARSKGWVVPVVAYGLATLVAYDRVNDRVHFASDVAAGAALGAAVGRFVVSRHKRAQGEKPATEIELVPVPGGLAARVRF